MIKILKTGYYSSIQDMGRRGFQKLGIPFSGVMDSESAALANNLLQNHANDALLEMTVTGAHILFEAPTAFALTGAVSNACLNEQKIENNRAYRAKKGDELLLGALTSGFRTYMAVKSGFQTPVVMGSRSYFFPVTANSRLKSNELIKIKPYEEELFLPDISLKPQNIPGKVLTAFKGPEFDLLAESTKSFITEKSFSVSKKNNRMAYQLNEKMQKNSIEMLTGVTLPGTVQLTPEGRLIALMRDAQTTGGYPRILQLTEASICRLSQLKTSDSFRFKLIPAPLINQC